MFTAEMQFRVLRKADGDAVANGVVGLIAALQRNGQILSDDFPIAASRTVIRAFVSIPERTSLQRKRDSKWAARQREELAEAGLSQPSCTILGREPETLDPCRRDKPSAFILYTDVLSRESPLRCARCFGPVPLYRIPHTSRCSMHEDIVFWQRNYQHCDALQTGCAVGERFGTRQLSLLDSDLSREGIECCRRITKVTKRPCYYYLYRYYGRSKKREAQRRCPSCGRGWLLKEAWHRQFDFRCDRCHLLSNLAYSVD